MFSKKTAVAAAALLAAFAAQAQSQVSIYGNLDVAVGRFDAPNNDKAVTAVESGVLRESYIGFKGQEDLGGGLKAFFTLESTIAVDTGSQDGNFWSRTSVVGLTGDFGTVALGNARTLNFLANQAYNPFGATGLFSTSNNLFGFESNFANSVTYSSPNLSGFTAAVQVGLSESNVSGQKDNAFGVQLNYAAGPLAVGATYEDAQETNPLYFGSNSKRWQLGASYDFGAVKLFGQYGQDKFNNDNESYKFFQVGAGIPVTSAGTVLTSYAQGKYDNQKLRQFSLAYDHALSKRTGAYVGVVNLRDNQANPKSGTSFVVGARHAF
ncbi:MAG: porin [Pseudomonadota bacterium]